jgi:hypothetical protein
MIPTHLLDGELAHEKTDLKGRRFYLSVKTGKRLASAGKTPVAILGADELDPFGDVLPEDYDPTVNDSALAELILPAIPTDLSFEDFAIAVEARKRMYSELGGVSARYVGDNTVILSLPSILGGSERYVLTFPATVAVTLTREISA